MSKTQELIAKMTKDLKELLESSEQEMNETAPLLEKEGYSNHLKLMKDTVSNAKEGKDIDLKAFVETFKNLK